MNISLKFVSKGTINNILKVIKVQFVIIESSCITYIRAQIGQTELTGVYPNYTMFSTPWF